MIQELTITSSFGSSFEVRFKQRLLEQFPKTMNRVALLVTSEYEGIFRNGGIGTYYRTLSEKLTAEGWYVVLLLCQSQEIFGGESHLSTVKHVFSTSECQDVLELQPMHSTILSQFKEWEWVDRENYCALFFAQAIAATFPDAYLYIEFPEMLGLGYRTVQAKRSGVLGKNCLTAVTLHSGLEWLNEAHGQYTFPLPNWSLQTSYYEQASFEQADLAFFPSHFLKEKVAGYGWKTEHALHLPYFVPEIEGLLATNEPSRNSQFGLKSDQIPVIFFGRLEERKGLLTFIEAIRLVDLLIAEKIQILFVGKNVQFQVEPFKHLNSEQYIQQELGTDYSYRIISDLYSREAIQLISQLNHPVVCLTSHQENFPNAALEMGQLPVSLVVSDTGGFHETLDLIRRSQGVRWFVPGDARSLSKIIQQAISNYPEKVLVHLQRQIAFYVNDRLIQRRLKYLQVFNSQEDSDSLTIEEASFIDSDEFSMLSYHERVYLENYTQKQYSGKGEIVDLGCWLGSSTIPLAIGLRNNAIVTNQSKRIHAYDIFIWDSFYMDNMVVGTALEGKYQRGDSFVDEYIKRIQPWEGSIRVYPGDLTEIGWGKQPIEFLFVDAMKSWDLANSILKNFFPYLIPELSLVVHQDFGHFYTTWIHLLMYRFREYLIPIEHPYTYSSRAFLYTKPIPLDLLHQTYSFADFSIEEVEAAFNYSLSIMSEKIRPNVAAAKVMYFIQTGNVERAKSELAEARAQFNPSSWQNLVDVEEWFERADLFKGNV
ncbi:MAG TPA: glycosyltransferase family 4 protein [Leptolyngbyaceae cyanobacterium M33_DOE_097]|uniref:Glycosyltransferase n=1 Tax=Oscillatoriales cyanobacterium SpSt-418 TaxID=2282169 RepID=A0A7C3PIH5_9CYAN|nr:glycosyltransferase family 4 protein [Leptolyngbyaceae cyanobacterium M33_DOE_097]